MTSISRKEFYEKAAQDPALNEKLKEISREYDEKLLALLSEAGYELDGGVNSITDEEAAGVSGGDMFADLAASLQTLQAWDRYQATGVMPNVDAYTRATLELMEMRNGEWPRYEEVIWWMQKPKFD